MKCPYQTKVIHKPKYEKTYTTVPAEDITVFCECIKSECPFYYTTYYATEVTEHCRRAESEVGG